MGGTGEGLTGDNGEEEDLLGLPVGNDGDVGHGLVVDELIRLSGLNNVVNHEDATKTAVLKYLGALHLVGLVKEDVVLEVVREGWWEAGG